MPDKLDYKKSIKICTCQKENPSLIDVPEIKFLMVDGEGDPTSETYKNAVFHCFTASLSPLR